MDKITWKDLNWPIRIGLIGGWVISTYLVGSIVIGFTMGFLGY